MPKIATWSEMPVAIREHLIERMRDRKIGLDWRLWDRRAVILSSQFQFGNMSGLPHVPQLRLDETAIREHKQSALRTRQSAKCRVLCGTTEGSPGWSAVAEPWVSRK